MNSTIRTAGSFDKVLASCKQIGERYQPKARELSIAAMSGLFERSQQTMKAVITKQAAHRIATFNRRESFDELPGLAVRIARMLSTLSIPEDKLAAIVSLKNQLRASRRKKREMPNEEPVAEQKRGASIRHFDAQIRIFEKMVQVLKAIGGYDPNEADLKLSTLQSKVADLQSKCQAVVEAEAALDDARTKRDQVFHGPKGMTRTMRAAKDYVRSVFGFASPEATRMTKA